jgi:hypothetical protein
LSATFDSDGLLGSILPDSLGTLVGFGLEVSFNRPPGIPSTAVNPIQLTFNLNLNNGSSTALELVVGADVDRTETNYDKVILDFVNKFYKCELRINNSTNAATILISNTIKNRLDNNPIPLMPVPVDRGSSDTIHIVRADVKVIDNTSGNNNDALGIMLTYGGGTTGNINGFTQAFSRAGAGAAVAINFSWICRNISPRVESAIGLPAGSLTGVILTGNLK